MGSWQLGETEKIWHQHCCFQSFSLPSSLRTIFNQLCVKPSVNQGHSVQHHPKDSALVGERCAANQAQQESPLPVDAPITLKMAIPVYQKHPAGLLAGVLPQE